MSRRPLLTLSLLASVVGAIAAGLPAARVAADDEATTRAELEALRERIDRVQQRVAAERERRDRASHELARAEQRAGRIAGRIETLDRRIDETGARLARLEGRRRELESELGRHRETLGAQLRAAYRLGRQPALRLLLRQDDAGAGARAITYYGYLNDARIAVIERADALLAESRKLTHETRAERKGLAANRADLAARRSELEAVRAERQALVARLDRAIETGDARIDALRADQRRLARLLDELGAALGDIPAAPLAEEPFASRSGALPWPVEGPLRERFGGARAEGRMEWRGMVIEAAEGTRVRAVYHGRVVFADWLSGFGQLVIIDHLDGHMSLYGYNRRLLRATGDWVTPGEPIATVGDSGGRDRPGLYFEIRRRGQPVDPLPWLASR